MVLQSMILLYRPASPGVIRRSITVHDYSPDAPHNAGAHLFTVFDDRLITAGQAMTSGGPLLTSDHLSQLVLIAENFQLFANNCPTIQADEQ